MGWLSLKRATLHYEFKLIYAPPGIESLQLFLFLPVNTLLLLRNVVLRVILGDVKISYCRNLDSVFQRVVNLNVNRRKFYDRHKTLVLWLHKIKCSFTNDKEVENQFLNIRSWHNYKIHFSFSYLFLIRKWFYCDWKIFHWV